MERFIFFLKFTSELPFEFFQFSDKLSDYGIKLVPIRPQELSSMMSAKHVFVLGLNNSIRTNQLFQLYRKNFLDYAILSKRVDLYDVTTFSRLNSELALRAQRNQNYIHIPLPDTIDEIVNKVLVAYMKKNSDVQKWPGGRRAKLPAA